MRLAQPQHGMLLQHAQQRRLDAHRQVADFIQEQGPAMRRFEQPLLVVDGARKRTAAMTEQEAGRQLLAETGAIDRHERLVAAVVQAVDRPGDQFLARARLAFDQHRGIDARHVLDHLENLAHGGALADDVRQPCARVQLASQVHQRRDIVQKQDASSIVPRVVEEFELQAPRPRTIAVQNQRELFTLPRGTTGELQEGGSLLAGQRQEFRQPPFRGPGVGHPGHPASRRTREVDAEFRIQHDGSVPLGVQDRAQVLVVLTQCAVDRPFVQRHLDRRVQVAGHERFHEIAVRFGQFGPLQRSRIGISGEEDNGHFAALANPLGGFDPVHRTLQVNVHQDQVGLHFADLLTRFLAGSDCIRHLIPETVQTALEIVEIDCDDLVILDNQDRGRPQGFSAGRRKGRICTRFHDPFSPFQGGFKTPPVSPMLRRACRLRRREVDRKHRALRLL